MTKKKIEQLRLNFEDFEEDFHCEDSESEKTNKISPAKIDYSFQNRLSKRQTSDNEEIYKEIRSLVKHLC